jgi:hypothetical protein
MSASRASPPTGVVARYGALARGGAPVPTYAWRYRERTGLPHAQWDVLWATLGYYRRRDQWPSVGQARIAADVAMSRPTVNGHLTAIRRKGHLATMPDPRYPNRPGQSATLFYCAEPYLACVARFAAQDVGEGDPDLALALENEGEERFRIFMQRLATRHWRWRLGDLDTDQGHAATTLAHAYASRWGVSFEAARRCELTAHEITGADPSVAPTQVEPHHRNASSTSSKDRARLLVSAFPTAREQP